MFSRRHGTEDEVAQRKMLSTVDRMRTLRPSTVCDNFDLGTFSNSLALLFDVGLATKDGQGRSNC